MLASASVSTSSVADSKKIPAQNSIEKCAVQLLSTEESHKIHNLLVKFVVDDKLPFRVLGHPSVLHLIDGSTPHQNKEWNVK